MTKEPKKENKKKKSDKEIAFNLEPLQASGPQKRAGHVIFCKRCGLKLTYLCITKSCEPPKITEIIQEAKKKIKKHGDESSVEEDEVVEQKVWKFFESKNKSYVLCSLCQDLLYIGGMSKTPTYQCYSTFKELRQRAKEFDFPMPNFEYWSGQGCIVYLKKEEEDLEDESEDETTEDTSEESEQVMVLTKEQQEIEDFLRKAQEKPEEEEYDYRKHEDFNFQAVFKKSVKEPKTRLVY